MSKIASVHRLKTSYNSDTMLSGLSTELMVFKGNGGTYKELSKRCGGTPRAQTISRVAYGDTRFPRMGTVVMLYVALGFNITVSR